MVNRQIHVATKILTLLHVCLHAAHVLYLSLAKICFTVECGPACFNPDRPIRTSKQKNKKYLNILCLQKLEFQGGKDQVTCTVESLKVEMGQHKGSIYIDHSTIQSLKRTVRYR